MPTKYSVEDAPAQSKYTVEDSSDSSAPSPGMLEPHPESGPIGNFFRGAGAGIYNIIAHPLNTLAAMGQPIVASGMAPGEMYPTSMPYNRTGQEAQDQAQREAQAGQTQAAQFMKENPAFATGEIVGPMVATHALLKGGGKILGTGRNILRGTLRNATNTLPADVAEIVKETSAANAAKTERVGDINARRAEVDQARADAVKAANDKAAADTANANAKATQEHAAKTQTVNDANAAAQAEFNARQAKVDELTKAAQDQTTRRGQLARQVQEQSARLVNRIQTLAKSAKGRVDALYDTVRLGTKGATVEPSELADAVQKAEGKIQGSSENIKVFRDILSKQPDEEEPAFIETPSEGKVPKGHALYDVLLSMSKEGAEQPPPMGFRDLQGYYSELGDKLASGNLPGDVYQALKSLQSDVGGMMQRMANEAGVGSRLKSAQALYHDYMQTFKENTGPSKSGSPIAQSLLAKDPAYAIKPLSADETAARVRNDLARFDTGADVAGGAAKLYDNFRQSLRDFDSTSKPIKVPPAPKPAKLTEAPAPPEPQQPKVKPVPEPRKPLVAKTTEFTPEQLEAKKAENIREAAEKITKSKSWVVNSLAAYDMIRSGLQGNWGHVGLDIMVRALYSAGKQGIAMALDDPRVVAKLSRLTPEDYADIQKLPPEQRTAFAHSIQPIVEEAARRGIRISPVLAGLIGKGSIQSSLPPSHQLAQSQPAQ